MRHRIFPKKLRFPNRNISLKKNCLVCGQYLINFLRFRRLKERCSFKFNQTNQCDFTLPLLAAVIFRFKRSNHWAPYQKESTKDNLFYIDIINLHLLCHLLYNILKQTNTVLNRPLQFSRLHCLMNRFSFIK